MVSQLLIDALGFLIALIIAEIPPLPYEFQWAIAEFGAVASGIAPSIAALGPVVPFAQINVVLSLFSIAVTVWLALLVVRAVLWAVNR